MAFRCEANAPTFLFYCFPLIFRHAQRIAQQAVDKAVKASVWPDMCFNVFLSPLGYTQRNTIICSRVKGLYVLLI